MSGPPLFSAEDVRFRVRYRLAGAAGETVGDHSFSPEFAEEIGPVERRAAAVLVPIVAREPRTSVLLTLRTDDLPSHGGQVAFPGGKIEPGETAEDAALREAEEEIGLDAAHVEILGRGPDYLTGSGFHITPVVALVRPGFALDLNAREVADAFEVPLAFLMDPANHRRGSRAWRGIVRTFVEMPYQDRYIWGITAGILHVLHERLYGRMAAEGAA